MWAIVSDFSPVSTQGMHSFSKEGLVADGTQVSSHSMPYKKPVSTLGPLGQWCPISFKAAPGPFEKEQNLCLCKADGALCIGENSHSPLPCLHYPFLESD